MPKKKKKKQFTTYNQISSTNLTDSVSITLA
jgi:hypothetical protein